jgi:hypothetical protein
MKDLTNYQRTIRFSLAFVWLFTAISVVLVNPEAGYSILATAGIVGWLAKTCVVGGGLLDLTIGVWLILGFQIKICCKVQCCVIIVYSILLLVRTIWRNHKKYTYAVAYPTAL